MQRTQMKVNTPPKTKRQITFENTTYDVLIQPNNIFVAGVGHFFDSTYVIYGTQNHYCGLQGFDPLKGDTCDGCVQHSTQLSILDGVEKELLLEGIIQHTILPTANKDNSSQVKHPTNYNLSRKGTKGKFSSPYDLSALRRIVDGYRV